VEFREIGPHRNSLTDFWRSYNSVWVNCWPRIAHSLLLDIASFGRPPDKLLNILTHKQMSFVPQTIDHLRRMEIKSIIFIDSVIVHSLVLEVTGFPASPPPRLMTTIAWAKLRKQLFPVAFHPSTEQFAAETWAADMSISKFMAVVGETYQISFRLTTTLSDLLMVNLRLYIDPAEAAETPVVESLVLSETSEFVMSFTPRLPQKFSIKGLRFDFFNAAPVAVTFPQSITYSAIAKAANVTIALVSRPDVAYTDIPFRFAVAVKHNSGALHGVPSAFIQTSPHHVSLQMVSPPIVGIFNKYVLAGFEREQLLEFELVPACEGTLDIHIFVVYTLLDHQSRFAVDTFRVDVGGIKKIHTHMGNDRVMRSPPFHIQAITSSDAAVHADGNAVVVDGALPSAHKKCSIEVSREVSGTVVRDVLALSRLFVRFGPGERVVERFPVIVDVRFTLLCLGPNEGRLVLKQPNSLDWCWIGKTKGMLKGPRTVEVAAGILANGPIQFDIADHLFVVYGNETRPSHHVISVRHI
jgi:hypothetical protein